MAVRLIVALIANAGAFVVTVRLLPGLQFAVGQPRGRIIEASLAFAVLGLIGPWLVRRVMPERPRVRRLPATAIVAVAASAIFLVLFALVSTSLGIGFRVGHLPGSVTADSFGWVALGAAGLALGPVATELIEPLIARAPSVSQAIRLPSVPILLVFLLSGAAGLIYMLGSQGPVSLDPANVADVLARPGIVDDLMSTADNPVARPQDWAARIDSLTWISGAQVQAFAGTAPVITDDRPFTEYFILRFLFGTSSAKMNKADLLAATPPS